MAFMFWVFEYKWSKIVESKRNGCGTAKNYSLNVVCEGCLYGK